MVNQLRRSNDHKHMYVPDNRAPKYMNQIMTELRGEIRSSTITGRGMNFPLSI